MTTRRSERRKHKRFDIDCPTTLTDAASNELASRTVNVSDGGMFLTMPTGSLPDRGSTVKVAFSLPRETPNTYMLEQLQCEAMIVRHEPCPDEAIAGVALAFDDTLDLAIEV